MIKMDGKYTTRNGQAVRILATDRAKANTSVVFLRMDSGGREYIECCDPNGRWNYNTDRDSDYDLIPAKQYRFKTLAELCKDYPDLVLTPMLGDLWSPIYNRTILSHQFTDQLGNPCDYPEAWDSNLLTEIKPITCNECPF